MKERPILFSSPMVRAILDGRKSQTRRVVKLLIDQPSPGHKLNVCHYAGGLSWDDGGCQCKLAARNPYGWIGDRLWVRETSWFRKSDGITTFADGSFKLHPTAILGRKYIVPDEPLDDDWPSVAKDYGFKSVPSIHMPHWASRITLEVTGVRVERLQEISEEDAKAEGVEPGCLTCGENCIYHGGCGYCRPAYRDSFCYLWDSINGKRPGCSWNDNPWVWVVEFKRVQ